jgi:hypothetical protein
MKGFKMSDEGKSRLGMLLYSLIFVLLVLSTGLLEEKEYCTYQLGETICSPGASPDKTLPK